jgi:hypothetical protein
LMRMLLLKTSKQWKWVSIACIIVYLVKSSFNWIICPISRFVSVTFFPLIFRHFNSLLWIRMHMISNKISVLSCVASWICWIVHFSELLYRRRMAVW